MKSGAPVRGRRPARLARVRARAVIGLLGVLFAAAGCSSPPTSEPDSPDAGVDIDAQVTSDAPVEDGEMRGVWITRFAYTTKAQLEAIIDRAAAANFNAVFVQIRGEGDAYYRSAYEPWARRLSGTLGRDPGWDPLQTAIDRAHQHGIELHAYFNVLSAWSASQAVPMAEGAKQHALRMNPDWLAVTSNGVNADSEYKWFSPGNPAVRSHIVAVATDLLANYAVDGLHLDRIRTPGPDYSRDTVTVAAYNSAKAADPSLTWADFMRSRVDLMVAELQTAITATRPAVKMSAAVWGIYEPLPGCSTSQGYRDYFQDSLGWVDKGIIDAIVPMTYWSIEPGACTDWQALTDGFVAGRAGRHVWAGMHALDDDVWSFDQVRARIEHARVGAQGAVVYASAYLDADPARWSAFATSVYAEPAPPPVMSWK